MKNLIKKNEDFLNTFGILKWFDERNKRKESKRLEKKNVKNYFQDINFVHNFLKFNYTNTWLSNYMKEEKLKELIEKKGVLKKNTYLYNKLKELRNNDDKI